MQLTPSDPISKLVFELSKLPGIGEKTATRLTYFILRQDSSYSRSLSGAIVDAKTKIQFCRECFTLTDQDPCRICTNMQRSPAFLCVVEKPTDIFFIEQSGGFDGFYHVLHGVLSPLDGVGPKELKIQELLARILLQKETLKEIILAINPNLEGETTSVYLAKLIKPLGIKVSQLAHGLPVGGYIEYSDRQTLGKALLNRMEIQ